MPEVKSLRYLCDDQLIHRRIRTDCTYILPDLNEANRLERLRTRTSHKKNRSLLYLTQRKIKFNSIDLRKLLTTNVEASMEPPVATSNTEIRNVPHHYTTYWVQLHWTLGSLYAINSESKNDKLLLQLKELMNKLKLQRILTILSKDYQRYFRGFKNSLWSSGGRCYVPGAAEPAPCWSCKFLRRNSEKGHWQRR